MVVSENGDGYGINLCHDTGYVESGNGGSDRMVKGGRVKEKLGDEILEDFDSYCEGINERLMVSGMVSDTLIKGMVTAVEQDGAERTVAKEMEFAKLKKDLQFHDSGIRKTHSLGSSVLQDDVGSLYFQKPFTLSDVFPEHERIREIFDGLINSANDQFKKLKKGIDRLGESSSIRRIGSSSELVGLGGILREQESESRVCVDKAMKNLKMTMDTIFTCIDEMVQLSRTSIGQWEEENLFKSEVEAVVVRSLFQSKHLYIQSCGSRTEKLDKISSLRKDLEVILKSLSSTEVVCLASHGLQDMGHFHRKMSSEHVTSLSIWEGNGKLEDLKTDIPEKFEAATLKHMSREEMVEYFNDMMTKMKRNHESILEKKTDEYFALRAEYLTLIGRGSVLQHMKDQGELDFLRQKIRAVISKLDDIFVETERHPEFTQEAANLDNLKDRIDSLLSKNHQLRELLRDKENEVKFLLSKVSDATEKSVQQSLAEANMQKRIGDLNLALEDSLIEASVREEVYKCFLRDLNRQKGNEADELDMHFHVMNGIYEIILRDAYSNAESIRKFELEDSELERLMMQYYGVVFSEAIKDAQEKLNELYHEYLSENEIRMFLAEKVIQMENELKVEFEEKEKRRQMIYLLETTLSEKEKLAEDALIAVAKEKEQFELVSEELNVAREHAARQKRLACESNIEFDAVKGQLSEASKQIEVLKEVINQLNQKLVEKAQELKEADDRAAMALAVSEDRLNILALNESKEIELRKQTETVICMVHGLSKLLADFECRVSGSLEINHARLGHSSNQLNSLVKKTNSLRRSVLLYQQRLERRCSDLQMAEAEVDLLGDEVDTLQRLLEKIYVVLDHYSPILQYYPGIIEILKLIRKELGGDSAKPVK